MSDLNETSGDVVRRRRGRPKKETGLIFYRDRGGRVKAWDPATNSPANAPSKLPESVRLYDGLGHDWANWGKPLTRDGDYNAARRNPFRAGPQSEPAESAALEEDYACANADSDLRVVLAAVTDIFDGRLPERPVVLRGSFWMRFLANVFVREAGEEGISRSRFSKPEGKVWASVNCLPSAGGGYNYTQEAWYGVVNMVRPPVFCVCVEGDDYGVVGAQWTPDTLASCVLWSLWSAYRTRQLEKEALKATVSDAFGAPGLPTEQTPPETAPQGPAAASEDPAACQGEANEEPQTDAVSKPAAERTAEEEEEIASAFDMPEETPAEPVLFATGKTWGQIKAGDVWLKGLTTAKDLQAPMPLARVLSMATDHEVTNRLTEECRALSDKKARNEFKRENLHVWYAAPLFADRFKGSVKENICGYTGLACLDFDGMSSFEDAQAARDDIFMEFKEVLFAAVSASGLGVYVLVTLDFDGTDAGYRTALSAAFEAFESKGYMPDTGCADPTRARYLSSDPDALSRPDAYVPVPIRPEEGAGYFVLPSSMLRQCWTNSARKRKGAGKEYLKEALDRVARAPEGMKDTTITSVMGTCARLIRNYGMNADEVYGRVRSVASAFGYDTKKTEDKIRRLGVTNGEGSDAR